MSINETYIPRYHRLPSLTGKDIVDLERYAQLPRAKTYERIQSFINAARVTNEVNVLFIKSEWGEGKSSIYEGFLQKPEIIGSDLVLKINTSRLILIIKEDYKKFLDTKSLGIRLFSILMYAIRDLINSSTVDIDPRLRNVELPDKLEDQKSIDFIFACLNEIFSVLSPESRLFIFLDEFEDIVDQNAEIQFLIIHGLVTIINGEPDVLCGGGPYAGKVHLMIAITPPAYETLISKVAAFSNIGRLFGQRVRIVELEKIGREDAYRFILGCLRYCWDGSLDLLPFAEVGMLNAIYLLALGNPRGMVELIRRLLSSAETSGKRNYIKLITPSDFIAYLSGEKITIHGGEVKIFDQEIMNKVIEEIRRQTIEQELTFQTALKLLELLISTPVPLSKRYIIQKLHLNDDILFSKYLGVIGTSLNRVRKIPYPFLRFKKVMLERALDELSDQEQKILKVLTFYNLGDSNFKLIPELFIPSPNLRELSIFNPEEFRQYIDYITSHLEEAIDENVIITIVEMVLKSGTKVLEEDYYMLSPIALSMFYTLPSIYFLDFIKNVEDRFNIGMEILRKTSEYESEFYKGTFYLLRDGLADLKMEPEIENKAYSSLEICTFTLKGLENCEFRAHITSILNWTEDSYRNIQEKIDLLKQFSVPLIVIFAWNSIPDNVRSILETHRSEGLIYNICFVLKTQQVYQIIARVLAENKGFQIVESRWKARASQIIEELKVRDQIISWIENGKKEGYTLTPLYLAGKSIKDLVRAFRTFLITNGSCKERFEQIKNFDRFRIFGTEFPLNPLDISSKDSLFEYAQILSENGFLTILKGEQVSVNLTNVENRILKILNYFRDGITLNDLKKMFVAYQKAELTPYVHILQERKRIIQDRDNVLRIRNLRDLENELNTLHNRIRQAKAYYESFDYGYLVSIKQRSFSLINIREYIGVLEQMLSELENLKYTHQELWLQKFIIFEILSRHFLTNIDPKMREFVRNLEGIYSGITPVEYLERRIRDLKRNISNTLGLSEEKIQLKEERILLKLREEINEIRNRSFNVNDIEELLQLLRQKLHQKADKGLAMTSKGDCYVFEVKILLLEDLYQELRNLASQVRENIQMIENQLRAHRELRQQICNHKLFTEDFVSEKTKISYMLLSAFRDIFKKRYSSILSNQYESTDSDVVEIDLRTLTERLESVNKKLERIRDECAHNYQSISEIISLEEYFISLENDLCSTIDVFERFYGNYVEILDKLFFKKNKFNEIREYYNSKIDEVKERLKTFEDIEQLQSIYFESKEFLKNLVNSLKHISSELDGLFTSSGEEFNAKFRIVNKMLEALRKIATDSKEINEILKHLTLISKKLDETYKNLPKSKEEISRVSELDGAFAKSLSVISELRQSARELFIKYKLLSDIELEILENFIEIGVDKVNIGLILPDMMEKITPDFRLLGEAILKLASLGLINVEISF
ncbi:MAG: hypothetical protein NDP22_00345 [Crenarchaeota archaeon]|nr:hypothetical protein [Thermoproteota archaeon]